MPSNNEHKSSSRSFQPPILIVIGLIILAGACYCVNEFIWPSFGTVVLFVGAMPFVLLGSWARWRLTRPSPPWVATRVTLVVFAVLLSGCGIVYPFVGVTTSVTTVMSWELGNPPENSFGERRVQFWYRDYPLYGEGLRSNALAAYLEEFANKNIDVEITVTRDCGMLRTYNLRRIGQFEPGLSCVRSRTISIRCPAPLPLRAVRAPQWR